MQRKGVTVVGVGEGVVMTQFPCPYFHGVVELAEERERHIAERHPDLLPEHHECIADTLANPDLIRRSTRFRNARLFSRWFDALRGGKYVVVVVVSEFNLRVRHWIITAYITRRLVEGESEWRRN